MERYKEVDLAYIAGLVDGEGYVGIKKEKTDYISPYYHANLQVAMTNEDAVKFMAQTLGAKVYVRRRWNGKTLYICQLSCGKAVRALKLLLPYLRVKKCNTEIILKLRESMEKLVNRGQKGLRGSLPLPQEILDEREECFRLIKTLNKRASSRR